MAVSITTNNVPRDIIYGYELKESQRAEFDWIDADDMDSTPFVKYKGYIYALDQFMAFNAFGGTAPVWFEKWQGYHSDSMSTGILIRFTDDCEQAIMATYCS